MRDVIRKGRLAHLISTDYGSRPLFIERHPWVTRGRLSQVLGEKEPFGEDAAIEWARKLGLPEQWFNNQWPTPKEARKYGWKIDALYPHVAADIAVASELLNEADVDRHVANAREIEAVYALAVHGKSHDGVEPAGTPKLMPPVRVKGWAKLGQDGYYEEIEGDGWVDSYSPDPDAYGLRVRGDSMHPAIRNGAVVVVEPNGQCIPTEYVAIALTDGKKMVKELVVERVDEVVVESVNGNHRQTIAKADILQMHPVSAVVSPSKWRPE